VRVIGEEALALRQGDRVRFDLPDVFEFRLRNGDQTMRDLENGLVDDAQSGIVEQVVTLIDGSRQGVFQRGDDVVGAILADGAEQSLKITAFDGNRAGGKQAANRALAEGSAAALEGDSRRT
jgi:hypothetical protein